MSCSSKSTYDSAVFFCVKIVEGNNPSRENAEAMENAFLARYDYAWNIRENGQVRNTLP